MIRAKNLNGKISISLILTTFIGEMKDGGDFGLSLCKGKCVVVGRNGCEEHATIPKLKETGTHMCVL